MCIKMAQTPIPNGKDKGAKELPPQKGWFDLFPYFLIFVSFCEICNPMHPDNPTTMKQLKIIVMQFMLGKRDFRGHVSFTGG